MSNLNNTVMMSVIRSYSNPDQLPEAANARQAVKGKLLDAYKQQLGSLGWWLRTSWLGVLLFGSVEWKIHQLAETTLAYLKFYHLKTNPEGHAKFQRFIPASERTLLPQIRRLANDKLAASHRNNAEGGAAAWNGIYTRLANDERSTEREYLRAFQGFNEEDLTNVLRWKKATSLAPVERETLFALAENLKNLRNINLTNARKVLSPAAMKCLENRAAIVQSIFPHFVASFEELIASNPTDSSKKGLENNVFAEAQKKVTVMANDREFSVPDQFSRDYKRNHELVLVPDAQSKLLPHVYDSRWKMNGQTLPSIYEQTTALAQINNSLDEGLRDILLEMTSQTAPNYFIMSVLPQELAQRKTSTESCMFNQVGDVTKIIQKENDDSFRCVYEFPNLVAQEATGSYRSQKAPRFYVEYFLKKQQGKWTITPMQVQSLGEDEPRPSEQYLKPKNPDAVVDVGQQLKNAEPSPPASPKENKREPA